jgi:eukaryotic-like serine/threonine-protein kinase
MPDLIGQSLGRYHILEQLGEGGMAVVYKALDTQLEREVAIKVIQPYRQHTERFVKRFRQEAKALARLNHPNIIKVLDYGEDKEQTYLVMELVDGETLKKKLGKPIPSAEAASIILPIARALAYAHEQGIIHRDVKPSNILIGKNEQPMLSDFGVAKILQTEETSDLTGTGLSVGTPEYMAPELGMGEQSDHRGDIYALGVVFYEMLTGRKPYRADTPMAVLHKQMSEPLPRPSQLVSKIPASAEAVAIKALAKDPRQRYQHMDDFAVALERLVQLDGRKARTLFLNPKTIFTVLGIALVIVLLGLLTFRRLNIVPLSGTQNNLLPTAANPLLQSSKTPVSFTETQPPAQSPTATKPKTSTITKSPAPAIGPTQISQLDGMIMLYIPSGEFTMGSDQGWPEQKPVHMVKLDEFWIDQTEVTNGMYALCVKSGKCRSPKQINSNMRPSYYNDLTYDPYPVIFVTWTDANNYCKWAGKRLPSEAEWEKAARGTDGRVYPWGNITPNKSLANFNMDIGDTQPVGSYPKGQSPYGALDMAGNVQEWVNDWYGPTYYVSSPKENPPGPANGNFRMLRGGSWFYNEFYNRSAYRNSLVPNGSAYDVGFRCAAGQNP